MITDDETTAIQLAIEANCLEDLVELVRPHESQELTSLQLFGNHSLLMYACERCSAEVVAWLIDRGLEPYELEWSDNNEIKSALRNQDHRNEVLPLVLKVVPQDLIKDMISSDWDPEDPPTGESVSPLEMAEELADKTCYNLLLETLKAVPQSSS